MSDNNQPTTPKNNEGEPDSSIPRDPQAVIVAAAAFAGGLLGAIVGGMVT